MKHDLIFRTFVETNKEELEQLWKQQGIDDSALGSWAAYNTFLRDCYEKSCQANP